MQEKTGRWRWTRSIKSQIRLPHSDDELKQAVDLWFHDSEEMEHGCRISIKIKDVLCHYLTRFQQLAIFETEQMGRMLVLDNITILTEFDEFAYHGMIARVPLLVHPNPSRVLIIGGGDGGTAREVLKHDPLTDLSERRAGRLRALKYYTPAVRRSAFSLPLFGASLVEGK